MYSCHVADEFITVAELRAQMARILARLGKGRGHLYLTQRGRPRAVLLDVDEYRRLIDQLEYLDDSLEVLLAREREARGEEAARPFDEVIAEIRRSRGGPVRKAKPLAKRARLRA
jgi:prevent-host-death family protein